MTIVPYTRNAGRRLTYHIAADETGSYTVRLNGKEMLRGHDRLSARGSRCGAPNKRKAEGAIHEAKIAIERLSAMDEF